jgi:PAS domain S-box-containing protein
MMETVSVLLLEDHEGEARLNQRLLERSHTMEFRFTSVRTLEEAREALRACTFNVLLLDLNLPDSNGIDTFKDIKAAAPHLPIVIISAIADDRLAVRCIRLGAQDYLVKGNITSEIMTRVVRYAMARNEYEPVRQMLEHGQDIPRSATFLIDQDGLVHEGVELARLLGREGKTGGIVLSRFIAEPYRMRAEEMRSRVLKRDIAEVQPISLLREGDDTSMPMLLLLMPFRKEGAPMLLGGVLPTHSTLDLSGAPEEKFRALLEHSQDGVFIIMDEKIVFANQALIEMTGYTRQELNGLSIFDLIAPENRSDASERYTRRVAGEEIQESYEISMLHKSGTRYKVQLAAGRLALNNTVAIMGTVKNVSEQLRSSYLLQVQHQLAVDLAYEHDLEAMFAHILSAVLRIESIDAAGIYVLEPEENTYRLRAARGIRDVAAELNDQVDFVTAHDQLVRESAVCYLHGSDFDAFSFAAELRRQGVMGLGIIPVTHAGRVVAALDVISLTFEMSVVAVRQALESIASFLGGVLTRISTEEALRDSEMLYRAVVEKSHDAIFIHQGDRLLFANERTCALTGYTKEELTEMNAWSLIHPDDRKRIQSIAGTPRLPDEAPMVYDGRILTRDGTIRAGEFAATLIRYERQAAALVTVRDITSRKSHEEELRRSDTLLRSAGFAAARFLQSPAWEDSIREVLEHFGNAANVCRVVLMENRRDDDGVLRQIQRHVWVRHEMHDSMIERVPDGQSWEDAPYKRWAEELSAGKTIASVIDHLPEEDQMTLARQNVRSTAMLPVFNGQEWWGLLRFDECRLRRTWLESEIESMVVCAQTLGAAIHRKQAEEQIVREKERAEQADAIKQAFISNMSHEVRTPLNIILGYLALVTEMTDNNPDEETVEFLRAIDDASQRLIRTVDSIMNISRFQTSDIALQQLPLRLDKLIVTCLERFQHEAAEKRITLGFTSDCERAEILADQHYLTESIEHLIDNAIKFTPRGGVTLQLESGALGGPRLIVKDTGIGISEDFLDRMYEPYMQEDIGYDRNFEGIGLGLTLVKLYLEAHGAQIHVHSEKGHGTTFTVDFPALEESDGTTATILE